VSWQLGAFAILAIALAAGFGWYERSRPDARMVALVATLAAFAALGRVAFAAVPNVKPTTDIVLISGYALGPAPGFVVGALAGLTSNFFFGQGPWTPWQMAGWGITGLIGAALAFSTTRRLGRWPLALVCAAVGFGFTALQDLGDWVSFSDHSLAQLGVYVGKGLGFDAVHAVGCLLFALAFGPALVRSVTRFSARLRVTWQPPRTAMIPVAIALALGAWLGGQPGRGVAVGRAAGTPSGYLLSAQNADGGFGAAPHQASTQLFSGWAALGLAAAGVNPHAVVNAGHSLIGYIESGAGGGSDPGSTERTILALRASGVSSASDVVGLEHDLRANGSVSDQTNLTAFAVLALRAAGVAPPAKTASWLAAQADGDGGFNYGTAGGASDVDDTGAALQALAGAHDRVTGRAVRFIESQQDRDGGFPTSGGAGSNAQSTAWAVQGLLAAGVAGAPVQRALRYLNSLIAPDGHVRYSASSDQTPVWVTAEALMALNRRPLPLLPAPAAGDSSASHHARQSTRAAITRTRSHSRTARRRTVGISTSRVTAPALFDRLIGYAGIVDALALAPIGLG
jgi:energy-coupling factor transport system substrate-specific component